MSVQAKSTIKSIHRHLLLGFKYGVQACAEVTVIQDVSEERDAEGNFTMVLGDNSESPDTIVVLTEDGAEGAIAGAAQ